MHTADDSPSFAAASDASFERDCSLASACAPSAAASPPQLLPICDDISRLLRPSPAASSSISSSSSSSAAAASNTALPPSVCNSVPSSHEVLGSFKSENAAARVLLEEEPSANAPPSISTETLSLRPRAPSVNFSSSAEDEPSFSYSPPDFTPIYRQRPPTALFDNVTDDAMNDQDNLNDLLYLLERNEDPSLHSLRPFDASAVPTNFSMNSLDNEHARGLSPPLSSPPMSPSPSSSSRYLSKHVSRLFGPDAASVMEILFDDSHAAPPHAAHGIKASFDFARETTAALDNSGALASQDHKQANSFFSADSDASFAAAPPPRRSAGPRPGSKYLSSRHSVKDKIPAVVRSRSCSPKDYNKNVGPRGRNSSSPYTQKRSLNEPKSCRSRSQSRGRSSSKNFAPSNFRVDVEAKSATACLKSRIHTRDLYMRPHSASSSARPSRDDKIHSTSSTSSPRTAFKILTDCSALSLAPSESSLIENRNSVPYIYKGSRSRSHISERNRASSQPAMEYIHLLERKNAEILQLRAEIDRRQQSPQIDQDAASRIFIARALVENSKQLARPLTPLPDAPKNSRQRISSSMLPRASLSAFPTTQPAVLPMSPSTLPVQHSAVLPTFNNPSANSAVLQVVLRRLTRVLPPSQQHKMPAPLTSDSDLLEHISAIADDVVAVVEKERDELISLRKECADLRISLESARKEREISQAAIARAQIEAQTAEQKAREAARLDSEAARADLENRHRLSLVAFRERCQESYRRHIDNFVRSPDVAEATTTRVRLEAELKDLQATLQHVKRSHADAREALKESFMRALRQMRDDVVKSKQKNVDRLEQEWNKRKQKYDSHWQAKIEKLKKDQAKILSSNGHRK